MSKGSEAVAKWRREHPDDVRASKRRYYASHSQKCRDAHAAWRAGNKDRIAKWSRRYSLELKLDALSHYGKNGKLQCCWPDCDIIDVDMLSLDHINDDGARTRKTQGTGEKLYLFVRKNGYPDGFQTLCHNHQWKKEINRRRVKG